MQVATHDPTSWPQLSTPAVETPESQGEENRMIAEMISESFTHVVLVTGSRSWSDEKSMRETFNDAWRAWGTESVTRPVLISGHCPEDHCSEGADAMAERLWRAAGFEVITFPADWSAHGKRAGFQRNQEMVDAVQVFREAGAQVLCTAFLDLCRKPGCPQRDREQLMPHTPGHFSHGTIHCRARASRGDQDDHRAPSVAAAVLRRAKGPAACCGALQGWIGGIGREANTRLSATCSDRCRVPRHRPS
ncbi:SLOG family protein [Streptomyces sp. SCSIO 30461]|uniref:SLOG family protein n=1 Tax=Streptomyces sp. SCSIO 30461 TaxID=3118085 RepID=UPI00387E2B26